MGEDIESSESCGGSYDGAIAAIAIGDDSDMDFGDNGDDYGFDEILAGITGEIDDADIDHEETRLRRLTGEIPGGIEMNPRRSSGLTPDGQMKIILNLREIERAILLGNLRECSSVVERLKEQLYESEDKRMELEDELDTQSIEVKEMKRELERMKEARECRVIDMERITEEKPIRREQHLTNIIEQQHIISSGISHATSPSLNDDVDASPQEKRVKVDSKTICGEQGIVFAPSGETTTCETTKSMIGIEFERKIKANPQYREEFERFKEFQTYCKEVKRNHQHQTSTTCDGSSDSSEAPTKDLSITLPSGEEYRKMMEFQVGYDRIITSKAKKNG